MNTPNHQTGSGWADHSYLIAPIVPFVYRVRDAHSVIIYIGKTEATLGGRFSAHRNEPAPWWDRAASVEALAVPTGNVLEVEASEIHRYHPEYNQMCGQCSLERRGGTHTDIYYQICIRLRFAERSRLYPSWADPGTFTRDVLNLLGERPDGAQFRLINPHGNYEPGNVRWERRNGPYPGRT